MSSDHIKSDRKAAGHTLLVFSGNMTATAIGFLANILVMRTLGPEAFGVVIVATVFLTVLWQFTGRGFDQAMVRCVASVANKDNEQAEAFCRTVHQLKFIWGGILVLVGLLIARPVTQLFLGEEVSPLPLYVAAAGALAASIWGYTGACLQSLHEFGKFAIVQVSNATARFALVVVLYLSGIMTPVLALAATGIGYAFAAVTGYLLAPRSKRGLKGVPELRPTVFKYSRWLIISSIVYLFYTRLDHLLLARLVGSKSAGIYGGAATFIQLIDLLTASLLTVFLPRACAQSDTLELRRQMGSSLRISAILALVLIPSIFILRPTVGILLGPQYALSVQIFTIIFPGAVFNMITHPLQAVMHSRGKTHLLTVMDILVVCVNGIVNFFIITRYGAIGAAFVALSTRLLAGTLLAILVARELYRNGNRTEVTEI